MLDELAGRRNLPILTSSGLGRSYCRAGGPVLACLLFFKMIMILFGPTGGCVVIAIAVFGAVFSRSALIGCVAGVLLIAGVHPVAPEHAIGVVVVSVVIAWVRFGGLAGEPIPLRSGGGARNLGLEQHADSGYLEVVLAYDDARHASHSHAKWTKRGRRARLYDGLPGFVLVQLTRAEAVGMQRFSTAMSLATPMPRMMADAGTPLRLEVPDVAQTDAPPITPEEIADRLRTGGKGRKLSGRGSCGEGAVIAVIDSGINERANRDLTDRIIHAEGFVPHEPGHDDKTDSQHGSNVLRIIAACAPAAKFIVFKVFDQNGTSTFKQFLEALDAFVRRDDATVANFSGGHAGCRGLDRCISCHAVNRVGRPFVGSAGNAGSSGLSCPGAASHAIGVAAGDANIPSRIADFSSRGPSAAPGVNPKPNVTAVGVNIQLKDRTGKVEGMNGTSFSAPQVSAGVAVVEAYARARNRSMTPRDLVRCVCESANPSAIAPVDRDSNAMGSGMVNIALACRHAVPETPWPIRDLFRVARALPRAAAVLALVLLPTSLGVAWWFGFDHVGTLKSAGRAERVTMLGRIHESNNSRLMLDDGTGWVQIEWVGGSPDPIAGSIVVLQGTMDVANTPVLADWSWRVWRPAHPATLLPSDQAIVKRAGVAPYLHYKTRGMVASGGGSGHLASRARDGRTGGLDG